MGLALELARRGLGAVEPNPPVGAVVIDAEGRVVGQGWHQRYGGPHAEVHALAAAGDAARGSTLFVTLEPCNHFGKTPPCTRAVLAAGVRRVVIATPDPAMHGAVRGAEELREAGLAVEIGLRGAEAARLIAPFTRLMTHGLPWVHAKWAMTLDGKIATRSGSSQWISNATSRSIVHQIRGRVDAIITGIGTAVADDPLLTARPPGPRTATRIVLDSRGELPLVSKLVRTAREAPTIVVTTGQVSRERCELFEQAGVEVLVIPATIQGRPDVSMLIRELGRRKMTHVLIESGGKVLGSFLDAGLINEVHAFVAPILSGGEAAGTPIGGTGIELMSQALRLQDLKIQALDGDVYIHGDVPDRPSQGGVSG